MIDEAKPEPKPKQPKKTNGKTNGRHTKPKEKPPAAKQDDSVVQFPQTDATVATADDETIQIDDPRYREREISALAQMQKGIDRSIRRRNLARDLGVSRSDIDDEVERHKAGEQDEPLYPHWIVEPWPEPVEIDALLRDLTWRIGKHVICSYEDALTVALWIVFAWCHDKVATHSPILDISSPEAESGKSTMLGVISFLAPRALPSVEISEAALYRSIDLWQPSFVIDEFDSVLAGDDKTGLRSVINSGHTRGQGVVRCVEPEYRPQTFQTFCPKAIGMIGRKLPPATLSRCIIVELRRRKANERIIEKFKHEDDKELADLRSKLLRWSIDNADKLIAAKDTVAMPEGFDNRRADNWRVLFAIADLAGAERTEHARAAATKIEGSAETPSIRVRMLADIRSFFYPKDDDGRDLEREERFSSADLAARLGAMAGSPWSEWKNGKPITQAQLANLLKPFSISPKNIRFPSGGVSKGYDRVQFEDVWDRYLSPSPVRGF